MSNWVIIFIMLSIMTDCSTVPVTGRRQLNLIPASTINSMSFQQYDEFISSNNLSKNTAQVNMVKRVGVNIQHAVEQYFRNKGKPNELKGYRWEFNLVDDPTINAWCMPGGKVVIYTGIMPICQDETGLAVVMGHEIAHAIAQHGNERMSQQLMTSAGGIALSELLKGESETTQTALLTAYGVGTQVGVLLPFSRKHESEADHLGLIFMAMAGYDPNESVAFWQRMSAQSGGAAPPEFLSTHPSDKTRISNLRKLVPEAMKYYKPGSK
ncbi:MAG: peptidase M48 [Candidatus Cloacimonetes bacterium 4572_55]|nr:MAG: peptidase M48 [Candidatus Cloacimonetes bacterium 4572_55]